MGQIEINNTRLWHDATKEEALRWCQYLYNNQHMHINDINEKMISGIRFSKEELKIAAPLNIWRGFRPE